MSDRENVTSSNGDLVVVGSSAGGIEALSILVSTLSTDFPAPIVLAQHLDPNRFWLRWCGGSDRGEEPGWNGDCTGPSNSTLSFDAAGPAPYGSGLRGGDRADRTAPLRSFDWGKHAAA